MFLIQINNDKRHILIIFPGVLDFSFDILSAVNHLAHAEHEDEAAEEEAHEKIKVKQGNTDCSIT